MLSKARSQIISLETTPYYHCMARCVRRAFLCGEDPLTGQNFDHRKQWLIDHFKFLSSVFAIDICAYAVMSNHYHLVLYINNEKSQQWTELEIAQHWKQVFKAGSVLVDRYLQQQKKRKKTSINLFIYFKLMDVLLFLLFFFWMSFFFFLMAHVQT